MWTAPRDGRWTHNFHSGAALQWGKKPSQSTQDSGPPHQFRQQWRPMRMGTPCLSQPKESSLSSLAGALLLLDSWHSPHSPALPSLTSPTSNADRAESACCPGSAAQSHVDHESAPTGPCDKFCNKNDWVLLQQQWAQSQRIAQHQSSPKLSSSCTFSWNVTVAGAHQNRFRHHLCQWCRPIEEEHEKASVRLAPVDSKHHLTLRTASVCARYGKGKKYHQWKQEIMLNYKQYEGKKTLCAGGKSNTNSSQWGQEFKPAPQHKQTDTGWPAGDLSRWWAW